MNWKTLTFLEALSLLQTQKGEQKSALEEVFKFQ